MINFYTVLIICYKSKFYLDLTFHLLICSVFSANSIYECQIKPLDVTNMLFRVFKNDKYIVSVFRQSILLKYDLILPIPKYLVGPNINNKVTTNQDFVSASFDSNDNPTKIILKFTPYTPITSLEKYWGAFKKIILTVHQAPYTNNTTIFSQNSIDLHFLYYLHDDPR
jgi:hypothetical protein